jgi:hypothetical protein
MGEQYLLFKEWFGGKNFELERIYRGQEQGFKEKDFHSACDKKGPTVTVIQSAQDKIFGGFTNAPWTSPYQGNDYYADSEAFIFSLTYKR